MSKGGGRSTTIQQADPWAGQQPALASLYRKAQRLPAQHFFPHSTVVPQAPETQLALQLGTARSLAGSPVQSAAQEQLRGTLAGDYLHGGPGFNEAFGAAQREITPMVQGQFEKAGRFGSGLAQEAETRALGDAFAGLYGQERNRQMAGLGLAPGISGLDYRDIGALSGVGAQREAFGREQMDDLLSRWQFAQQSPYQRLAAQSSAIQGGFPGGTQSTSSPYYRNPLAGAIGGGLTGAGLGTMLGNPLMTAPVYASQAAGGGLLSAGGLNPALLPFALGGSLLGGLLG